MKFLTMILLTLLMGKGCSDEEKQELGSSVIEYSAMTRGFSYTIQIQDKKVTITKGSREKTVETKDISDQDWKSLIAEVSKLQLEQLSNLKAPTEKRFYDGAAIANLKITYQGKEYKTTDFDDGFPPAEIESLVNKITIYKPSRE